MSPNTLGEAHEDLLTENAEAALSLRHYFMRMNPGELEKEEQNGGEGYYRKLFERLDRLAVVSAERGLSLYSLHYYPEDEVYLKDASGESFGVTELDYHMHTSENIARIDQTLKLLEFMSRKQAPAQGDSDTADVDSAFDAR